MLSPETRPASLAACSRRRARHQAVDALVHVAQPLLQPHHRLAVGGEAEMAGLDDAGVHRPDRDLVHRRAFGRMEGVGVAGCRRGLAPAERVPHAPAAVVEPAARIGRVLGLQPVEVADGALQPQGGRMQRVPIEGNRPVGQASVKTPIRPSSSTARCTVSVSPHRPTAWCLARRQMLAAPASRPPRRR